MAFDRKAFTADVDAILRAAGGSREMAVACITNLAQRAVEEAATPAGEKPRLIPATAREIVFMAVLALYEDKPNFSLAGLMLDMEMSAKQASRVVHDMMESGYLAPVRHRQGLILIITEEGRAFLKSIRGR